MKNIRGFGLCAGLLLAGCSALNSDGGVSEDELAAQRARCEALEQDIAELEGKPLRRTAAREYYEQECLNSRY